MRTEHRMRKRKKSGKEISPEQEREIEILRAKHAARRKQITLFKAPVTTLRHFTILVWQWQRLLVIYILSHRKFILATVVTAFIIFISSMVPGSHEIIL